MTTNNRPSTESLLVNWRSGQASAERLASGILRLEGYTQIDPQMPLGGADGGKDILCFWEKEPCIAAVYFPTDQNYFSAISKKFEDDIAAALGSGKSFVRFVFVTNQRLTVGERAKLEAIAAGHKKQTDLIHIERIRSVLDSSSGYGLRLEFLNVEMTREEQLSFVDDSSLKGLEKLTQEMRSLSRHVEDMNVRHGSYLRDVAATTQRIAAAMPAVPSSQIAAATSLHHAPKQAAQVSENITVDLICFANRLALPEENSSAGVLRKERIWIGGAANGIEDANLVPPAPDSIPELLSELCAYWNGNFAALKRAGQFEKLTGIAKFAHKLLFIHPFVDGNGRTVRAFARQQAYDLLDVDCVFPFGPDRPAYVTALMKADTGDFRPLVEVLRSQLFPAAA